MRSGRDLWKQVGGLSQPRLPQTSWREGVRKQSKGHERHAENISGLKKIVGAELVTQEDGYCIFRTSLGK